jgi:hypothetical protein
VLAPDVPLERYGYALAGILICGSAAAVAIETWRREGFAVWGARGARDETNTRTAN